MTKEFVRRVSEWHNKKTDYTRKQIVLPQEVSKYAGRMCRMMWDEEAKVLIIKFSS